MFAGRAAGAPQRRPSADGELAQLEARRHHDVWDRLGAVTCPTFVGCRPLRRHRPGGQQREPSRRASPGAELHVYEGGHLFFVQDPTALPDVIAFLGR